MRRSRAEPKRAGAALLLAAVLAGCHTLRHLGASVREHPPAFVGAWTDVAKTSARDSSVWILGPNGDDDLLRITHDATDASRRVSRTRYGYWYARTDDGGAQWLCVTRRPGRDPASCTPVNVGADATGARRRMTLAAYAGAHRRGVRELIELR